MGEVRKEDPVLAFTDWNDAITSGFKNLFEGAGISEARGLRGFNYRNCLEAVEC